jgi:membrane-associated phospholipid phosphatase
MTRLRQMVRCTRPIRMSSWWAVGPLAFAFPVLIGLSCVFTKQHYLVDVPAGAALAWLAYRVFQNTVMS